MTYPLQLRRYPTPSDFQYPLEPYADPFDMLATRVRTSPCI